MALGKAFIEVHADTKPFAQELGKELGRILKVAESGVVKDAGHKMGKTLADGASEGFEKNSKKIGAGKVGDGGTGFANQGAGLGKQLLKGLIDTIDDGLSGLPGEVKAALAGGIVALLPVAAGLGGALGGAIVTGLVTTVGVGVGVALASQYEVVQDRFADALGALRILAVEAAEPIVSPLLAGIDDFVQSVSQIDLRSLFQNASAAIQPLLQSLGTAGEVFVPHLADSLKNAGAFAEILGNGIVEIADALGSVLAEIANDDDAQNALADTLIFVEDLIRFTGGAVKAMLDLWGVIRQVGQALTELLHLDAIITFENTLRGATGEAGRFGVGLDLVIGKTKAEEEAAKKLTDAIEGYTDAISNSWDANIDFEQSLDDMSESLRKNRGAIDLDSQAGRDHQASIKKSALALREQRDSTIALTGDTVTANRVFEENRRRLEAQAVAGGITKQKFAELTAVLLNVPPPVNTGIDQASLNRLVAAGGAAAYLAAQLATVAQRAKIPLGPIGGYHGYADGGVFNKPTLGVFGEAGEEVIIPTTKPARAAQLIASNPTLSSMMNSTPTVNVYIGNQQLDAYIDSQVSKSMASTARGVSYGSRSL